MFVTPGCFLKWSATVDDIVERTSTLISHAVSVYDKVGSSEPASFKSVVLVNIIIQYTDIFPAYVTV